MSRSRVVLELPAGEGAERVAVHAERRGFHGFLIPAGGVLASSPGRERTRASGGALILPGRTTRGVRSRIGGPKDLPSVVAALRRHPVVLAEFVGDRVIPLENLIALRQGSDRPDEGELWVRAPTASDVPGLLGALEHGSDRVVLAVATESDVDRVESLLDHPRLELSWKDARVVRVEPGGVGERVAVDTTSLLGADEGILVGSQGAFLLLVISEAQGSRYTRPRPFRVNAGAVHSYTLLADGTTRYLSELEPGDRLVATRTGGSARSVRVGRLKIERRPLTLVEVETGRGKGLKPKGSRRFTLFVQEAETVRLSGRQGPVPVGQLRPGMRLAGVALPEARHFGMAVEETILER